MLHNIDTIKKMLTTSGNAHLADSYDLLSLDVQCGISKMVEELFMSDKHYKIIQQHVVSDVISANDGLELSTLKCFSFIHQQNATIGTI